MDNVSGTYKIRRIITDHDYENETLRVDIYATKFSSIDKINITLKIDPLLED